MTNNQLLMMAAGVGVLIVLGGKTVIDLKDAGENEKKFAPVIAAAEKKYGIPPGLLHRLIREESAFRTDIITGKKRSSVGAMGIAQFMPSTAREVLGSEAAALDPYKAIDGAGKYLRQLYQWTHSRGWKDAVAAYNWGVGNVNKKGLAGAPAETKRYVSAVIA